MLNIIKAEFLKSKNGSTYKFTVIMPVLTILISCALYGGAKFAYNLWYIILMPALISILATQSIDREKRLDYKAWLLYPISKVKLWLGKIIFVAILLGISSIIFAALIFIVNIIYPDPIPSMNNIFAISILYLTFVFQIPICQFLCERINAIFALIVNLFLSNLGSVLVGSKYELFLYNYGVPAKLMVPIIEVLPNGLKPELNNPLLNANIFTNSILNILLFVLLSLITTLLFKKIGGER
ncbi:MAG: lantibiotic immunity ABC transporter MutE/EpiE family permease subunit [Tissierellia bacterium]|nr:lantibiotic immunity ABC transporter MutE/EpiE family permease subunit [Tissierellia bacterium]